MDRKHKKIGDCLIPISSWRLRIISRRAGIKNKLNAGRYAMCRKPVAWPQAFSLPEVIVALVILALVSSSVLVVINRCMASAADSALRMQAFEVARENMEKLLTSDSVAEKAEYGTSDKYPQIQWQTTVEAFYEPVTVRMWAQAICSAEYTDSTGQQQTVELTHWLTDLTKKEMLEILQQQQEKLSAEQVIETIEEAAKYAGVDVETIEQWVENGMLLTEEGYFIKGQLELYKQTNGNPSIEEISRQAQADLDSEKPAEQQPEPDEQNADEPKADEPETDKTEKPEAELICGYTMEELMQLDFQQIWEIISNCDEVRP